ATSTSGGCGNVTVATLSHYLRPCGTCTMTTTTNAAAADPILAIDLGRYKSVACVVRSADAQRFTTIRTSRAEISRLLAQQRPAVVLIEACLLSGWVHDLCVEHGVRCLVANTASEAWKFKHLKRKTDKDDAQRLTEVYSPARRARGATNSRKPT